MSEVRKIVLVGNFLPDRQESMQRFSAVLAEGFTARGIPVEQWRPDPWFARLVREYRYGGLPKYLGYLDKFVRFPRLLRRRLKTAAPETVYHITDHGNAVYAPHFGRHPVAVTCHDLLQVRSALGEFPLNRLSSSGQRYQRWILASLAKLRHVPCNSHKTRSDLRRLTGLPETATPMIHIGLNYPYRPMAREEARAVFSGALARQGIRTEAAQSNGEFRFLFGIGGAQWYKNRGGLIAILGELQKLRPTPLPFVFCGAAFEPAHEAMISRVGLREAFVRVPNLTNEELRAAYSLSEGLLFPSWEEGFGWPIAEAQACGCPVFTSNREPMTEVGGEAACYIDPAHPAEAAKVIAGQLADTSRLRDAGLRHASLWDTSRMLDAYADLYVRMLSSASERAR